MDIGEEKPARIVQPLENPVPEKEPAPVSPVRTPSPAPVPEREPVKV
ncbi:hypothetical protein UFOVP1313_27 [uncultured Caudovirales phage]|uniref:Uncharacterized protein n=1 Tax=uncultured Caudovirales phage TaxID=2100421 RepID=A0A6J5RTQ7_9CAUD|nr:hypothetical protein UFOVP1313_27 [uncultured Caudovirales phage]